MKIFMNLLLTIMVVVDKFNNYTIINQNKISYSSKIQ